MEYGCMTINIWGGPSLDSHGWADSQSHAGGNQVEDILHSSSSAVEFPPPGRLSSSACCTFRSCVKTDLQAGH